MANVERLKMIEAAAHRADLARVKAAEEQRAALVDEAMARVGTRVGSFRRTQPYWGDERMTDPRGLSEMDSARVPPPWRRKFKRR